MKRLLFLFIICIQFAVWAKPSSQTRKVLVIGIDGVRSDALQQANTPTIDSLVATGLVTWDSWHCGTTVSGPSWSNTMCGVWEAKHGVTSNSYANSNYNQYPYFVTRAKEKKPNLYCVQIVEWAPMSDNVYNDSWDKKLKTPDGGTLTTQQVATQEIVDPNLDCMFLYYDIVDLTGHSTGFSPFNPAYMTAIQAVDASLRNVMTALRSRANFANEDWLVLITTDHGGIGTGHGGNTDFERKIWWVGAGANVIPQQITAQDPGSYVMSGGVNPALLKLSPVQTDIAVTALHHLIYDENILPDTVAAWNLDGKSWLSVMMTGKAAQTQVKKFLKVFPNPTDNLISFWFDNPKNETISYKVMTTDGKMVEKDQEEATQYKLTLELCHLPKGIYFVSIKVGNQQEMIEKVVLH